MKRTFPIIVILISLSLCGLFLLQASWFDNLMEVTRTQLIEKINMVGFNVANDIGKSTRSSQPLRLNRRGGFLLGSELQIKLFRQPTVEERFTMEEVRDKISKEFQRVKLNNLKFEFAISDVEGDYEFYSTGYEQEFWDTINNKRNYYPIIRDTDNLALNEANELLIIIVPDLANQVWYSLRWILMGAVTFFLIILAAFYVTVKTLLNQKKLSQIKSDFINNMTHEFKTPLATISLAVDALKSPKVQANPEKGAYFTNIIKEENIRMNKHVETILQAAFLEKQELNLNLSKVSVHEMVREVAGTFALQLQDKNGNIDFLLNASNDTISADDTHFRNMISNLIDNAIKYSQDPVRIIVSSHSTKNHFVLRVQDNGIGMNKESVKRIFEKFYRAHTGNLHNVKGFGLGMSYVKTVIDAHKGKIKVDSAIGKGTSFTIEVPLMQD
ncbi:sensor histidine kinase [Sediminibacterium salmoneum]|uniref:sensor histidine kinase n=1 Tax=Sediminibacterium salmoneum TaxID=426421 RepID=UPI00047A9D4D|nr:HAMP domain-containing sensor histidine kinase [Sediminibacterium salmoneum]